MDRPNIIYVYLDDAGYGDFGCYGQTLIQTPEIDRMASEGIRFTEHYAGTPVCAPARCNLMTGKHNGHAYIRNNGQYEPHGQTPLREGIPTVASLLKDAEYRTAAIGKWGLGIEHSEGDPNRHGFDLFYGYYDQVHAHNHWPEFLYRNGVREDIGNTVRWNTPDGQFTGVGWEWGSYATDKVNWSQDLFLREALRFIQTHHDDPFFLYFPVVIPHLNGEAPQGERSEPPILDMYRERNWGNDKWGNDLRPYASGITALDTQIGQIREQLAALGIENNTLIIVSSDNGYDFAQIFESNGGLRGAKRSLYEGGIRMPHVAVWPGVIAPGRVSEHISAQYDFLATACDVAGVSAPQTDGISYLPELRGEVQPEHEFLYFEFGIDRAVRIGRWKAVQRGAGENANATIELYDLVDDRLETTDVAHDHPDVVEQAYAIMLREHETAEVQRFRWPNER